MEGKGSIEVVKLADLGFRNGINEVIGITVGEWLNTAPLGLIVEDEKSKKAKIRLYSNHTRKNIEKKGEIWLNLIHDPVVFAICSFDDLDESYFESFDPPIIKGSLSWCRMVAELTGPFAKLELVEGGVLRRELKAVNRGFNAIIEALVHSTRLVEFGDESLRGKVEYYLNLAMKCGGERERKAVGIIKERVGIQL